MKTLKEYSKENIFNKRFKEINLRFKELKKILYPLNGKYLIFPSGVKKFDENLVLLSYYYQYKNNSQNINDLFYYYNYTIERENKEDEIDLDLKSYCTKYDKYNKLSGKLRINNKCNLLLIHYCKGLNK